MKIRDKVLEKRIIEKLFHFLSSRGLKGWNMDQLAASVGIAKNTLYKIISSKEELLKQAIEAELKNRHEKLIAIMNSDCDFYLRIENIILQYLEIIKSLKSEIRQEIFLEYPLIEKEIVGEVEQVTGQFTRFIQSGIEQGYLKPDFPPHFIMEIIEALTLYFMNNIDQQAELAEKLNTSFHCFLEGIKKGEAGPKNKKI